MDTIYKKFEHHCERIPIIIHPSCVFDKYSSPTDDMRIIDTDMLLLLKTKIKEYCNTISTNGNFKDLKVLSQLFNEFSFTPNLFFNRYSKKYLKE